MPVQRQTPADPFILALTSVKIKTKIRGQKEGIAPHKMGLLRIARHLQVERSGQRQCSVNESECTSGELHSISFVQTEFAPGSLDEADHWGGQWCCPLSTPVLPCEDTTELHFLTLFNLVRSHDLLCLSGGCSDSKDICRFWTGASDC